jgi:eukaryotic-like serine/threonine-protein kinase
LKVESFFQKKHKILIIASLLFLTLIIGTNFAAAQNPKVLFDESKHPNNFYSVYNLGPLGTSSFATLLEQNGFSVSRSTSGPINAEKLKGYDVLVLMGIGDNYTDDEVTAIKDFVNNGGGLYIIGSNWGDVDGDQNFSFNKIAQSFGVTFANNEIVTDDQHSIVYPIFVHVTDLRPSPITNNVTEFYYIMGTYLKDPGTSNVVAYSDNDSYGDKGTTDSQGVTVSNDQLDPNETSGPLPLSSTMEYGKGKIVFTGDASTYENDWIYRSNGWKLGLNSVSYLADLPVPATYKTGGIFPYNVGDMGYRILGMILLTLLIVSGLFLKIRSDKKLEGSQIIKTIKNWKYDVLIVLNGIFAVGGAILFIFIPVYYSMLDSGQVDLYDPYLAYTLLIMGVIFIMLSGLILFNLIVRKRIARKYNYLDIAVLLFFAGLTVIMDGIFSSSTGLLTLGSLILLISPAVNLLIKRIHGPDLIIEGKEFDRLNRVSDKSLPFELQPFYTNSSYLGEGGFGRVFKATRNDGMVVAIKIPKSFDKKSEKTFISEVSNWSQLIHPNIVKLYDYKILPIPYIETEYCEGYLEKGMKPLKDAVSIIYQVAKGLEYAHSKNIIHGDMKISNILTKNGIYKISDWGLSKLKTGDSVTLSGATPSYAAPEQISQEFGRADERTDIYQLGNVFYELVTGNLPFKGEISQIYSAILHNEPTIPSEMNPKAKEVDHIIMKCLNKNKEERYSSMKELLEDLEKYHENDETILFKDKDQG